MFKGRDIYQYREYRLINTQGGKSGSIAAFSALGFLVEKNL